MKLQKKKKTKNQTKQNKQKRKKNSMYYWAIPDIRCTPCKEDMGIQKLLPTFFIGNSPPKKKNYSFGREGKDDTGIAKIFVRVQVQNMGIPNFVAVFDI